MKKLLSLMLLLAVGLMPVFAFAASVDYDVTDITGTISNIGIAAVAVIGAFITYGLTVMFYRKIRGLASRG